MIEELFSLFFRGLWQLAKLFYHFLQKHPRYAFLLPTMLISAYVRAVYILSSSDFLGISTDDSHIIANLFHGQLALLGALVLPANITLGPFYDYLIAPAIWLMGFDPMGPAIVAAFASIASVYLLYLIGKQFFNLQAGIFAAGLAAVSSFAPSYAYLSWNVDLLPFFSLLLLWVMFKAAASVRPLFYYLFGGFLLAVCLQLHYVAIFLLLFVPLYMIVTETEVKGKKFVLPFFIHSVELFVGFFISLLPFFFSEMIKGFPNLRMLWGYMGENAHQINLFQFFWSLPEMLYLLFARLIIHFPSQDMLPYYMSGEVTILAYFSITLLVLSLLVLIFFARNRFVILALLFWLLLGTLAFGFFKNDVYDYHFSLLYPVYFLLAGNLLATIFHLAWQERVKLEKMLISRTAESQTYTMIPVDVTDNKKLALHILCISISILLFFSIVLLNFSIFPFRHQSQEEKQQSQAVASFILDKANKKPLNLALIPTASHSANPIFYVNALKQLKDSPIRIQHTEIDPQRKTITDQLYVVCETSCKPFDSTLWDIKGFGKAAVWDHWQVGNVTVYKIVHFIEHS